MPPELRRLALVPALAALAAIALAEPPAVTDVDNPIGTITIVWHDCSSATLTYDIDPPGVMGEMTLRRIVPDNVALCQALAMGSK